MFVNHSAINEQVFTSESVSEGHPDKICDIISDAIVDRYLRADPEARVAVETVVTKDRVFLLGEIRSLAPLSVEDLQDTARRTLKEIGCTQEGFDWQRVDIQVYIHGQSVDTPQGAEARPGKEEGACDQGIVFGYACKETEVLMPAPIYYAHRILQDLTEARKSQRIQGLRPDAKSQVSLYYREGKPIKATSVVLSTQHEEDLSQKDLREYLRPLIVKALPPSWVDEKTQILINSKGRFVIGGAVADTGLTGRKIIVDTYGGACPHGGGAFSGKDPTKLDRSGAYMARYLAKNTVAAGLAERCMLQLSYAIGFSQPVSLYVHTYGTGVIEDRKLGQILLNLVDLSPRGLRESLSLNRPIYKITAAFGHFGRMPDTEGNFPWEQTDLVKRLIESC